MNLSRVPLTPRQLRQHLPPYRSVFAHIPDVGFWRDSEVAGWTEREPLPVVVIHGTVGKRGNFARLGPRLRVTEAGVPRRVFSVSYGDSGTVALMDSVADVEEQLCALAEASGAPAFDVVAHSQGGLVSLIVASRPRAGKLIHHIVGLGSDFRGVVAPWSGRPGSILMASVVEKLAGPAFAQQLADAPALAAALSTAAECHVPITQIASRYDQIVPLSAARALERTSSFTGIPAHPGPLRVVEVQEEFPSLRLTHNLLLLSSRVARLVQEALAHPPQGESPRESELKRGR